jgi:hypothetical protein
MSPSFGLQSHIGLLVSHLRLAGKQRELKPLICLGYQAFDGYDMKGHVSRFGVCHVTIDEICVQQDWG